MLRIITLCIMLLSAASLWATEPAVYTSPHSNHGAGGHDVVAYFTDGKPVKGNTAYQTKFNGASWLFASAEHLARFKANPEKYAPAYGGYCAWAVSQGYLAKGNPRNWTVVDGRLYLNYNDAIQKKWLKDIAGFITAANAHWPAVLDQ
ncbi:YHS domain-containing (seleno)protein [Marinobacter caseinilyticus]|uniref:YHS domain-containing (seleno)protein n=1 Tax=Marinobacter caseinilyticus TaxID=2692195 RepID=UPI00140C7DAC|nr:YHS domain-containing (seleno)protein [Marinobacter caseinilyticus]